MDEQATKLGYGFNKTFTPLSVYEGEEGARGRGKSVGGKILKMSSVLTILYSTVPCFLGNLEGEDGGKNKLRVKIPLARLVPALPTEEGCFQKLKKIMLYVLHLFSKIKQKKNNKTKQNKNKNRQHMNPQCEVYMYMYFLEIKLDWL